MFHKLTLPLTIITSLVSGAGLAQAATATATPAIAIRVAGRTPQAVRADVVAAARKVCAAIRPDLNPLDGSADDCVNAAIDDAMSQLAPLQTA